MTDYNLTYLQQLLSNVNIKAFLLMIRKGEGTLGSDGYRKLFGGTLFSDYNDHPNIIIHKSNYDSSAAGAYQILSKNWFGDSGLKNRLSLPNFTPIIQDASAVYLIYRRGALQNVLSGFIVKAIDQCKEEWASLPGSTYGQPQQKLNDAIQYYVSQGGTVVDVNNIVSGGPIIMTNRLNELLYPGSNYTWATAFVGAGWNNQIKRFDNVSHPSWGFYTSTQIMDNFIELFKNVIDPATQQFGKLTFSSGLRNYIPTGGSSTSAHLAGCAIDIIGYGSATKRTFTEWVVANRCNFIDQLLYEASNSNTEAGWLHIGIQVKPSGQVVARKQFRYAPSYTPAGNIENLTCGGPQGPSAVDRSGTGSEAVNTSQNAINADKQLAIDLKAVQANVDNLEKDDVQVNWGSRNDNKEQSDWIGLRQYLIYLSTTYLPANLVPFIELIPKFLMDEPKERHSTSGNFDYDLTDIETTRFENSKSVIDSLNKNGGIDLLTIDPFNDLKTFADSSNLAINEDKINSNGVNTAIGRNFGYRIFGNIVLTPGIQGAETSKAGTIGFKSLEIVQGSTQQDGLTLITVNIVDVQGNKFLDISSPWSFLLNATQLNGDFFFRYGWQIEIPKKDDQNVDKLSTSYKFWNHPGWRTFGSGDTDDSSIKKLKNEIASMALVSSGVLTLTQSGNIESIKYPGYKEEIKSQQSGVTSGGNTSYGIFQIDRLLDLRHYLVISMLNRELSIDSNNGSITASIQFRANGALANCLCQLADAKETLALANKSNDSETDLYTLMVAFLLDNKKFVSNHDDLKSFTDSFIDVDKTPPQSWIIVQRLSNPKSLLQGTGVDPKSIKIKIPIHLYNDLNNNHGSAESNLLLRGWLNKVCEANFLQLQSSGDAGTTTVNQTSGFYFIWDDLQAPENTVNDAKVSRDSGSGYLGNANKNRLVEQDDVFAFRFRGSLVEELSIENNDTQTKGKIESEYKIAQSMINNANQVTGGGVDKNASSYNGGPPKSIDTVTWFDKKRYEQYILANMSLVKIKAIGHPWLRIGFPIYVKGTGVFDGKYVISKLVHKIENNGKFYSSIDGVKVQIDNNYNAIQEENIANKKLAQETGNSSLNFASATQFVNNNIDINKANNPPSKSVDKLITTYNTAQEKQASTDIANFLNNLNSF